MSEDYCGACDPNPGFAGDMFGFDMQHSCKRWKGKSQMAVLSELFAELRATSSRGPTKSQT